MTASPASYCVGIDLGTTFSCCAYFDSVAKSATVFSGPHGGRVIPSVVLSTGEDDAVYVGEEAIVKGMELPHRLLYDAKRLLGVQYDTVAVNDCRWTFGVEAGEEGATVMVLPVKAGAGGAGGAGGASGGSSGAGGGRGAGAASGGAGARDPHRWRPEEVSARVLAELKRCAEEGLGVIARAANDALPEASRKRSMAAPVVSKAVVTVPANFDDSQRKATKDAAHVAGFTDVKLLNEPTAAAYGYGLRLGTGVAGSASERNVLVFDLGGGTFDVTVVALSAETIEVLGSDGERHLGGQDFTRRLVDSVIAKIAAKHPRVDLRNDPAARYKLFQTCDAAKRVLSYETEFQLEVSDLHPLLGATYTQMITRAEFVELNQVDFDKAIAMAEKAVRDADLENSDITEVVLVGGSARIPYLRTKLREKFDHEPRTDVNPDEAVAVGAALYADSLFNKAESVVRATCRLRDVTTLSLGIQIKGDVFSVIVPRNSPLPIAITKPYTTTVDDQETIGVKVYQGQHAKASANAFILEFSINEIRKMPAGGPSIEVTIELNEEGTLKVTAKDKTPGSAGCTETRSVAKDRRRLRDAEIAAMNARVVASSHAFARLRDTLLARDNVLATLARGRLLHTELTTEAPGKPRPVITPALTALKTLLDSTKTWAERPEEIFKTETRASCAAKDRALKDAANAVRSGYM